MMRENQVFAAALRGEGRSIIPMITMLTCFVGLRQIYLYVMSNYISNTPLPIIFSYAFSWIVASVVFAICYFRTKFESTIL